MPRAINYHRRRLLVAALHCDGRQWVDGRTRSRCAAGAVLLQYFGGLSRTEIAGALAVPLIVPARGMVVFARIDHAEGAAQVGMALLPTELVLFGHPRGGTRLMQERRTAGIDLPLKALAWEDAEGKVWLSYNEIPWLLGRHNIGAGSSAATAALEAAQEAIIAAAIPGAAPEAGEQ